MCVSGACPLGFLWCRPSWTPAAAVHLGSLCPEGKLELNKPLERIDANCGNCQFIGAYVGRFVVELESCGRYWNVITAETF